MCGTAWLPHRLTKHDGYRVAAGYLAWSIAFFDERTHVPRPATSLDVRRRLVFAGRPFAAVGRVVLLCQDRGPGIAAADGRVRPGHDRGYDPADAGARDRRRFACL